VSADRGFVERKGLTVNQSEGVLVFTVVGLVVATVLGVLEILSFLRVGSDVPLEARLAARSRLVRRGLGALMLAGVVVLARYMVLPDNVSIAVRLARMGGCLVLCVCLFLLSVWDFRIVRREIQGEFQGLQEQSLGDLQRHLEAVAAQNPDLARQLPELLNKASRASQSLGPVAVTGQTEEADRIGQGQ
jgi:hypothetical protein